MSDAPLNDLILPRKFLRMCRRRMRRAKVADSTGVELSGAGLLTRTLVVRRLLRREVLAEDERNVGVLLPPSVGGLVVNAALAVDGRVAVNLNYTVTSEVMNDCIRQCGIRHVLTSRRVMERFNLILDAKVLYLEDFLGKVTLGDKLASAAAAWLAPIGWLERRLGLDKLGPDDLLTIIFTSGSTGRPKGVMLTQQNVASNVAAIDQIVRLADDDVLLGILPLFHSFGYTVTMWTVLSLPPKGIYHYSPLEAREVGKLCRRHGATIMIATPTFLRSYLRRCDPEDFAQLDVVFTGAERLSPELAEAFEERFGVHPVEGYGATETVAGRLGQRSAQPRPEQTVRGRERRHRRPAPARHRSEMRRSRHGRRPGTEPLGHVAGQGPERNAGLLRSPRSDGRSHARGTRGKRGQSPFAGTARRVLRTNGDCPLFPLVHHRRRGRNRRRGLHQDHRTHQPLLETGRRNGAAHPRGRGHWASPEARRRRPEDRGHLRA